MTDDALNLERLDESLQGPVRQYAELLHELGGAKVRGLTVFGAAAAGTFDPLRHSLRNVLVLTEMDLDLLRRIAEHGAKLGKAHISAPLVMTPSYIDASRDTFPLELLEIKQVHVTVFGPDEFAELSFDDSHIRLQCERELKRVLIGLRQGLLAAAGRERELQAVEADVAEGLIRTIRGMLWVKGNKEVRKASEVLSAAEKAFSRDLAGIRAAMTVAEGGGWEAFQKLYRDVEGLAELADA